MGRNHYKSPLCNLYAYPSFVPFAMVACGKLVALPASFNGVGLIFSTSSESWNRLSASLLPSALSRSIYL